MDTTPQALIDLNQRYRNDVSPMLGIWEECGRMCLTRKVSALNVAVSRSTTYDQYAPDTRLLNSVAVEANEVLAAGCMSWIMPSESPWFVWKPTKAQEGNDAVEEWLQHCTDVALEALSSSSFYSRAHEVLQDRSTFGTACLWAEAGKKNALNFKAWDVGTFVIAENDEGDVDTVFREIEHTAKQASEMFAVLPPSITANLAREPNTKHRFLRAIFPREMKYRAAAGGPKSMPYASIVIHVESKMIVSEGGFQELPAFVTRYLKWSEGSAYGVSPAMRALAEIRGVNYLEMLMSTLAEVTVNPRIIQPQGMQGVPDLRAGGITIGGLNRESFPQEWMTGGNFDIGLKLIERKEKAINDAFHRDLFEMFAQRSGQMNIPHVQALEAEKLARFSPAFSLLTTEFINPILERVFMILWRSGRLPPPPKEALVQNALGQPMLLYPRVAQTSRMALAMQSVKRSAFSTMFSLFQPLTAMGTPVLDNLDTDRAYRDLARGEGLPADYLVDQDTVKQLRQARSQAQQAQQQQQMMMEAAKNPEIVKQAAGALNGAQLQPQVQQ